MTTTTTTFKGTGARKFGLTVGLEPNQYEFLDAYRRRQGMRSLGDAARELMHLGSLSVTNS